MPCTSHWDKIDPSLQTHHCPTQARSTLNLSHMCTHAQLLPIAFLLRKFHSRLQNLSRPVTGEKRPRFQAVPLAIITKLCLPRWLVSVWCWPAFRLESPTCRVSHNISEENVSIHSPHYAVRIIAFEGLTEVFTYLLIYLFFNFFNFFQTLELC